MTALPAQADAVVIGGGFYGCIIALYLAQTRSVGRVVLLERESGLLQRASYHNQARVHNGYHYPRSFTTAFRSRVNFPRFIHDWPHVVHKEFLKVYAIARRNSKVTARQFERFCHEIGALIQPADPSVQQLFEPKLIEKVYVVQEYAFDAARLAAWACQALRHAGVHVVYAASATTVERSVLPSRLCVGVQPALGPQAHITTRYVMNCTYSGLNQIKGHFAGTHTALKHELTEMALVTVPAPLSDMGVTVMDGPFFSLMPFPPRQAHTLSHVRYTPHFSWHDTSQCDPYATLAQYDRATRVDRMLRDVSRYIPLMQRAQYVDSLFEIKTVLIKNEGDDGRPILFERYPELPGCYSVLGGKIDNIYDVLEKLDTEDFRNVLESS